MLDEGTTSRTAEVIALAVESMGAAIEASCGWDGSYVSFRCLKASLPSILDLTVDILLNPTFPEWSGSVSAARRSRALKAEADSAESRRTERSWRRSTQRITLTDFRWPAPKRAWLASAPIDLAAFHAPIPDAGRRDHRRRGRRRPRRHRREFNRRLPDRAVASAPRWQFRRRRTSGRAAVLLLSTAPGPRRPSCASAIWESLASDPAFEHALLLNQILGGQFSSRLNAKLREERGFTYGVAAISTVAASRVHFRSPRRSRPIGSPMALNDIRDELDALDERSAARPSSSSTTLAARSSRGTPATSRHPRAREPLRRPDHSWSAAPITRRGSPTGWPPSSSRTRGRGTPMDRSGSLVAVVVADAAYFRRSETPRMGRRRDDRRSCHAVMAVPGAKIGRPSRDARCPPKIIVGATSVLALSFTTPIIIVVPFSAFPWSYMREGFSHGEELAGCCRCTAYRGSRWLNPGVASATETPSDRFRRGA